MLYVHVCEWVSLSLCIHLSLSSSLPVFPHQIIVQHPAAKSMIEISRTQDEEVGDGTTSVIILGNAHHF